ncbi:MAG: hypothetical protein ACFCD0_20795 [Gemmataceae bacterium]
MRTLLFVAVLTLAGCQNVRGPLQYREPLRPDDPAFPIDEQQRRGRDRIGLPDISREVGPSEGLTPPRGYQQ